METGNNVAVEAESVVTEEQVAVAPEDTNETGSKESELAEQTPEAVEKPQDSETNRAFQKMRKANEDLQRELDSLRAEKQARNETFERLVGSGASDISVIAEASGLSEDEVRAEFVHSQENYEKDAKIDALEARLLDIEAEKAMAEDLATIRRIDPSIKSLEDLGEGYAEYVGAGLSAEKAYWAIKAEKTAKQATPPKEAGKIATGTMEKDTFTDAEISAMSSEDLTKNWKKILKSWEKK